MKISEFIEKLQEIEREFGDIEMALEDAGTDLIQSFDVVLTDDRKLFVEVIDIQQYCVIPCVRYRDGFL